MAPRKKKVTNKSDRLLRKLKEARSKGDMKNIMRDLAALEPPQNYISLFDFKREIIEASERCNELSQFARACMAGHSSAVTKLINEKDELQRPGMLEMRETALGLTPLLLTILVMDEVLKTSVVSKLAQKANEKHPNLREVVYLLLKEGACPTTTDSCGNNACHYAASINNANALKAADHCIDAAKTSSYFGQSVVLGVLNDAYKGKRGILKGYDAKLGKRIVEVTVKGKSQHIIVHPRSILPNELSKGQISILDVSPNLVVQANKLGRVCLYDALRYGNTNVANHFFERHDATVANARDFVEPVDLSFVNAQFRNYVRNKETLRTLRTTCEECGKKGTILKPIFICSRCQKTCYCSEECQRKNWKSHKKCCMTPTENSVKLERPVNAKELSTFKPPPNIKPGELFWVVIGGSDSVRTIEDKTKTFSVKIKLMKPGWRDLMLGFRNGKKAMKASFDASGNCLIYPDTAKKRD